MYVKKAVLLIIIVEFLESYLTFWRWRAAIMEVNSTYQLEISATHKCNHTSMIDLIEKYRNAKTK
jgi:hypothetical protein